MKNTFLFILAILAFSMTGLSQQQANSKLLLKNKDVLTGKILEMKPGEYVKIEMMGNNILSIPYADIAQIIMDGEAAVGSTPETVKTKTSKSNKPLGNFYFETINEFSLGLGMGEVFGYGFDTLNIKLANRDTYGGFYTVNGVGYKNMLFAGIGIGILGHSGYADDYDDFGYSLPFTIDVRYRPLAAKQFSPLVMVASGMSYYEGSMGTFTVLSGLGLSIRLQDRFDAQLLLTHHYDRFSPNLSVENGLLESFFSGVYVNYAGARLGISYRL
jgi:hypothetical protein